ncbi:MAG TPA: D-glycerate dehydrogenase [Thermomicrobiaceae bacterium]|nr:D-glycerate dehydrogenase [Thermomicrobiaceae bacterium]
MRVAVTRVIPESGLELLRTEAEVALWPNQLPPSRDELIELARGADGLLTLVTDRVDGELLDALPAVRVVSNYAVGFDNIDVPACTARNVAVCTTPDVLTDATADFGFTLLLAAARKLIPAVEAVRDGDWLTWEPMGFLGQETAGRTLGVIGLGRIGAALARRGHAFGMRILYADAIARPELERELGAARRELDALLAESDFVSVHVPLTPQTQQLIGARELALMKPSAVLINTSRGPVVDNDALADALERGTIWAAALDVTEPEPLPATHRLVHLPNAIVTPHIASATFDTRSEMSTLSARNVLAVLHGETPPRCLNPEVLGRARR